MNVDNELILNRIEQRRKELRYSQESFAKLLKMTKNGYQYIIREKDLKLSTFFKIAKALEVPVSYFFEESKNDVNILNNNTLRNNTVVLNGEATSVQALAEKIKHFDAMLKEKDKRIMELKEMIEVLKKN